MKVLLLLSLLTQTAPDAGAPATLEALYTACADAPLAEVMDGGYFVPEARARRNNCKLAACEAFAEPKLIESSAPHPGTVLVLVGGAVIITIVSAVAGYIARDAFGPKR